MVLRDGAVLPNLVVFLPGYLEGKTGKAGLAWAHMQLYDSFGKST